MEKMGESLLDISKALRCPVCNKYIISYKEMHKGKTCSKRCALKKYNNDYYINALKKIKQVDSYKEYQKKYK